MLIGDKWEIKSDELNYILYKKRDGVNRKTGEQANGNNWEAVGYFSKFKNAWDYLVEQELCSTEMKDMKTILNKLGELQAVKASLY